VTVTSIPILLFPASLARRFKGLTPVARLFLTQKLRDDIAVSRLPEGQEPELYGIAFIISSLLWGILFAALIFFLQAFIQLIPVEEALPLTGLVFVSAFIGFFYLHYIYPSILAQKSAETTDRQLLHVLRDMWVQSTSGVPLYAILSNVSQADYGFVSDDLRNAVRAISGGERDIVVLEKVAQETRAEEFKRALWHITSSMRTGVGLTMALENTVNSLTAEQYRSVKEYGSSLNFYLLIYLLFAAVIPSIVTTFVSLLSIFGIFTITLELLLGIVLLSVTLQFILIGLMRIGRPEL
jgi:pilus assembly protein TadC